MQPRKSRGLSTVSSCDQGKIITIEKGSDFWEMIVWLLDAILINNDRIALTGYKEIRNTHDHSSLILHLVHAYLLAILVVL